MKREHKKLLLELQRNELKNYQLYKALEKMNYSVMNIFFEDMNFAPKSTMYMEKVPVGCEDVKIEKEGFNNKKNKKCFWRK